MKATTEQIKALQENLRQYDQLQDEDQQFLCDVKNEHLIYLDTYKGIWEQVGRDGSTSVHDIVYQLKADYKPESGIVECEIRYNLINEDYHTLQYKDTDKQWRSIGIVPDGYIFIGFKFEDGEGNPKWYPLPIMPVRNDCPLVIGDCDLKYVKSGTIKVLHATHILFQEVQE